MLAELFGSGDVLPRLEDGKTLVNHGKNVARFGPIDGKTLLMCERVNKEEEGVLGEFELNSSVEFVNRIVESLLVQKQFTTVEHVVSPIITTYAKGNTY